MYKIRSHLLQHKKTDYSKESDEHEQNLIDCFLGTNPEVREKKLDFTKYDTTFNSISKYPHNYGTLKNGLMKYWSDVADLNEKQISVAAGSCYILEMINKIFLTPQSKVLGIAPQFSFYISDILSFGSTYDYFPLDSQKNWKFNIDEFLKFDFNDYTLIHIDNPNNPTGQIISITDIERIVKKANDCNTCVLVDEAYGDYMAKNNSALTLLNKYSNVIITRTFSKGFGLAGIRIGYVVANSEIMKYYLLITDPYTLSTIGAECATEILLDEDYIENSKRKSEMKKNRVFATCKKLSILETAPQTPILTLRHPNPEVDLQQLLISHGVKTASGKDFLLLGKNSVRFRVPHDDDLDPVIKIIHAIEKEL
jgi:histidinol-phosphate aminotransferase